MASIYYDLAGFSGQLPNGVVNTTGAYQRFSMARLVWAAVTIGTTPFGPRLHAGRALEVQWRSAMIRSAIQLESNAYRRSARYARLDPSEKGAVSFFLGQVQAKLFAAEFFHVSRFVHYDAYLTYRGQPRRSTRPDFIGFYGRDVAIGVEAKGRSDGFDAALIAKAKTQARSLPTITGHRTSATYVHVAYFDHDRWCAYLEDPPRRRQTPAVDPASLTVVYYQPIVNAIRTRDPQLRGLRQDDGPYLRAYFAEVDVYISVRADIAELVPTDEIVSANDAIQEKTAALYDLMLRRDAEQRERGNEGQNDDDSRSFRGGDGIAVELGTSWQSWDEAQQWRA
jgi:hypothetical protein